MITHLLYLHGFRSSPQSTKARTMAAWVKNHAPHLNWWCPQLPPSPRDTVDQLLAGVADWPKNHMAIIGSSLGGFYATVLAQHLACKTVLLNPAVNPARDLACHVGINQAWHGNGHFSFLPSYLDELREMTPREITIPTRYFVLISTGDEVLDWREMSARYRDSHLHVVQGSDHALSDFETHLPQLLNFLHLASLPSSPS